MCNGCSTVVGSYVSGVCKCACKCDCVERDFSFVARCKGRARVVLECSWENLNPHKRKWEGTFPHCIAYDAFADGNGQVEDLLLLNLWSARLNAIVCVCVVWL